MNSASWSKSHWWAFALLGVIAAVLIVSHTPLGAALSLDSLLYLSTAHNILDGNGVVQETFALSGPAIRETTIWPPLYPALLAGVAWVTELTGSSDVFGVAAFNFLGLVTTLYLMLRASSCATPLAVGVIASVALALAPSLQIVFTYVWSEVVFIPLCLAAYLNLQRYFDDDADRQLLRLVSIVVLFGLATYTRYVGLAFYAAASLALLLFGRGDLKERLRTVVLMGLAYVAILLPMLIRNFRVSGSLSGGERGQPNTDILSDLGLLGSTLNLEFFNLPSIATAALLLVSAVLAIGLYQRSSNPDSTVARQSSSISIGVPFIFVGGYLVFLLISRATQVIDLDSRMVSVVVPFILIGLAGIYQKISIRTDARLAALPFLLPLLAFTVNAVQTHMSIVNGWREYREPGPILGLTYLSITGQQMDVLRGIEEHFSPAAGSLVLTDVKRPIIMKYLFPETDVRQMPAEASKQNFALLEDSLQRLGFAIITTEGWSRTLSENLDGRAEFFTIQGASGRAEYVVIKLPVTAP